MIRIFSHYVSAKCVLLVALETLVLTTVVFAGIALFNLHPTGGSGSSIPALAVLPAGMLLIFSSMGLYQTDGWDDLKGTRSRLFVGGMVACLLTAVLSVLIPSFSQRADLLLVMVILGFLATACTRFFVYKYNRDENRKPRVLVLGNGSRASGLSEALRKNHTLVGYVHLQDGNYVGLPVHSSPGESLLSLVKRHCVDEIVIGVRNRRGGALPVQDLLQCRIYGVKVYELPTFFERERRQVLIESINPSWLLFGEGFSAGATRTVIKRLFDIVVSAVLLVLTLPILALASVCVLLESTGPLLYRQERVGRGGRIFTLYKLRSMQNDAEKDGQPRWASTNDRRVTRVGAILRKLRIDELPQVYNVLRGDMSFVGPRPERPFFVDKLVAQIPYYAMRHSVNPGITGWAQVRYPYGASLDDTVEKLQYDLYYVKNHGLFLDWMILLATIEVVLWGKGAR
jgi:sugar transferase (PEP-CTERM system associated)